MNLTDFQTVISIKETYLEDEEERTQFIIRYLTWDSDGIGMECEQTFDLTPLAQKEILEGLTKLIETIKDIQ